MREIKFRAWYRELGKWAIFHDECHLREINNDDVYEWNQFVGVYDKNGVEIYEGDIIKNENTLGEIKYVPERVSFLILEENGYSFMQNSNELKTNYEVIGNIYENKELLEGK